ncbi:HAD family phosphatase [Flavobacterium sp.]|jgi:HAD superfamily hydrolase (TIGR01509 family)|uniref:HAD family hydrolase n=1 Tax=Flavobacterium sp. TaxID=239 RepID=UPI0022BB1AB4|nr:HAD family hydrolase [Flavobacterium sp.]MCZ8168427.1 HAD family hydrolase [Flavobacterium sp.]MCZ8368060.1 HAD family hydrolase [Flavobacterium sp.]
MLKTVIFDMDGVIVDTEPVHHFAYHQLFNQLGITVSPDLYASFTGNSTKNIFQKLKAQFELSQSVEELVQAKRDLFNDAFDHKDDLTLLDGVERLIKELKANDIQLILASSSAKVTIQRVFNRFQLFPYFTHIVSGEDFPQSKPHPAIFLEAVRLSQHQAQECMVIEDSTNGIAAAKGAGVFCIGYDSFHSKNQDYSRADWVVKHFDELSFEAMATRI